ncbi:hypothetical protein [Streptomyces sp. NPDC057257]|uniref:hypothetical protein n=1 Tax=Streptomyces sp. NPDC057257 TaxID=3346071 RepID=UPI0036265E1F
MKKAIAVLGAVFAVFLSGIVLAPAASAGAYGCAGSQVDSYPMYGEPGVSYGTIYLYYDTSTGKNCAVMVSTAAGGYGVKKSMQLYLRVCSQTTDTGACTETGGAGDNGNYAYYAGPVSVKAAGHCIRVVGVIGPYKGNYAGANDVGHCD